MISGSEACKKGSIIVEALETIGRLKWAAHPCLVLPYIPSFRVGILHDSHYFLTSPVPRLGLGSRSAHFAHGIWR
jgi:hypothetical protein